MKKLIVLILLFSVSAQASCDWKTGITPGPNNTFIYTQECHQEVGKLVEANKDLTQAIQIKDLAIQQSDSRIALWEKTAGDEQDRLVKMDSEQHHNDVLAFVLGVAVTIGAAYAAGQIIHR